MTEFGISTDIIVSLLRKASGPICVTVFTGTIEGYNIYKNSDLTKQVQSHPESIEYVNNIKQALDSCLKENCGDIKILQYDPSKRFINDIRRGQPFVKK